ncbi:unnamed protein product [Psylliodes chrysocephalus]|uniref:CRAL-TRIO domain-containing protein n=1 Tax=Psylliodes chrysocephalus TaxID=3402493 RepID=A0A9P0D4N2_9CUCU|nr:unnamed protein product [Psylliodes chrysocephala]
MDFKFKPEDIFLEKRTNAEYVETITKWLPNVKEKYVPKTLSDEMMVLFLLSCTNDINLTKRTIISYYKLRKASPLIFDNRRVDCPEIQSALKAVSFSVIPKPIEHKIILFIKLRDTYYKNAKVEYAIKIICMLLDVCQEENPPDTIIVVIDMYGFGVMHMTMLHIEALRTIFAYVQEACPIKLKTIHFVNSNLMLQKILSFCKIFMKQELIEKIHCHKGIDGLSNFISKEYLPQDYGGDRPSTEELRKTVYKKFEDKQTFWEAEEKMRKQYYC